MIEGFTIVGNIEEVEVIAVGSSIRILSLLNKKLAKEDGVS